MLSFPSRPLTGYRLLGSLFAGLCFAWVCAVHGVYLTTFDDGWFTDTKGAPLLAWTLPSLVLPFGLFVGIWQLNSWVRPLKLFGLIAGGLVGLCLNTFLLTVPYLGYYPSVPLLPLGLVTSGGQGAQAGPSFFLPVLAGNVLLWAVVGGLIGRYWSRFVSLPDT